MSREDASLTRKKDIAVFGFREGSQRITHPGYDRQELLLMLGIFSADYFISVSPVFHRAIAPEDNGDFLPRAEGFPNSFAFLANIRGGDKVQNI